MVQGVRCGEGEENASEPWKFVSSAVELDYMVAWPLRVFWVGSER
jgi:hypothetical protein